METGVVCSTFRLEIDREEKRGIASTDRISEQSLDLFLWCFHPASFSSAFREQTGQIDPVEARLPGGFVDSRANRNSVAMWILGSGKNRKEIIASLVTTPMARGVSCYCGIRPLLVVVAASPVPRSTFHMAPRLLALCAAAASSRPRPVHDPCQLSRIPSPPIQSRWQRRGRGHQSVGIERVGGRGGRILEGPAGGQRCCAGTT